MINFRVLNLELWYVDQVAAEISYILLNCKCKYRNGLGISRYSIGSNLDQDLGKKT